MEQLIIETKYGKVSGVREGACVVFKGIPYAKAPVGDLRFRAPQKPDAFEGVFAADHFGNRCAQDKKDTAGADTNPFSAFYDREFYDNDEPYRTPIEEDGLYLNIWIPQDRTEEKLPVYFYIHGGGFCGGTGHEKEFRTDAYAKRGVILVTINYRLGIFGYMAHPWLLKEDPRACGNYGTLDQMAALDWVRENIAAFGGDPENITIGGQSAGGMSVHALTCVRDADEKYQKAIIQSAAGYPNYIAFKSTLDLTLPMGERAAEYAGAHNLEELRAVSTDELLAVQGRIIAESFQSGQGLPYSPVVNGVLLKGTINECMEQGQINLVPTIIGCNRNDISVTPEEVKGEMDDIALHRSDVAYSLQRQELQQNPSYVYFFDRDLPGDDAGSFHSAELWYTFGTLKSCWRPMTEADERLSDEMISCWTNFMKTGDPNGAGLTRWDLCTKEHPDVRVFDVEEDN